MSWRTVGHIGDLEELVNQIGILPFFRGQIPGWSLEEHILPDVWFTSADGPWEWKGRLAKDQRNVYGRFIAGKNAWVSLDCFPDLANLRRDGYDFEGRCEDGLVPHRDRQVMAWIEAHAPVVSKAVRRECGVSKGYDTVLTRLQMQTFVINQDFVYDIDRHGHAYGWGNALLTTPEKWFGEAFLDEAFRRTPEESLGRLRERIAPWLSWADPAVLTRLLRGS